MVATNTKTTYGAKIINANQDQEAIDNDKKFDLINEKDIMVAKKNEIVEKSVITESGWAWVIVIGGFVCRFFTDGLVASLGMFIMAWLEHFQCSMAELSWISSLIPGLQCMVGPLGSALLKRFSIRQVVITGSTITSAAFIAASFATSTWHLYLTSTAVGLGLGLIYTPSLVILTYYFDTKLGRVNGLASCGSAMGLLFLPSLFQILISYYNWQGAILILAALVANMGICGAVFRPTALERKLRTITEEEPSFHQPQTDEKKHRKIKKILKSVIAAGDLGLFKDIYFLILLLGFYLYGIAFIIFSHYLSLQAVNIGFSKQYAAFLVSFIGVGSGISRLTHGILIDRGILSASALTSLSYIVCGVSNLLIPLVDQYAALMTLAVFIGLSSGVYHTSFPLVAKDYVGIDHISCGIGWLMFVSGFGNLIGAYLTGIFVDATGSYDLAFYLAGICFIICALFTSVKPLTENFQKSCTENYECKNAI